MMITEQLSISLKNPVVSNHKVYGQDVLPGLAYIDLIYQIFSEHGLALHELELRNVSIYNPLIVDQEHEIILTIQCVESPAGQWRIRIDGQAQQKGHVSSDKKLYITADMVKRTAVVFEEALDVSAWKQAASSTVDLAAVYAQCRSQELVHTDFMQAEGKIYETEEGILIDVALGQAALAHAESFLFHPTLLDGSGIGSGRLLAEVLSADQTLYLPLFFESFCATELLQRQCFTRIQRSSLRPEKELIYVTLEFFNASGQKVAELKNFASKLVRGAALLSLEHKTTLQSISVDEQERAGSSVVHAYTTHELQSPDKLASYDEIEDFVCQVLARWLEIPEEQIDTQVGYYQMGLDSQRLLAVVETIGTRIGVSLSPTLLFEYTTIADLSTFLAENYAAYFRRARSGEEHQAASSSDRESVNPRPRAVDEGFRAFPASEDIAVIGLAGRYPQASTIQEFWDNLQAGKDCITEIPQERWDWHRFDELTSPSGKPMSHWGGFLDDVACFDPQFFRISPREAEIMDPQERLFLETCWETIEDAGYTPGRLVTPRGHAQRRAIGVFAGVMHKDYTLLGAEAVAQGHNFSLSLNSAQIANRVSYHFNFHGPSITVDTVCSSSLTAVHLALESIRHGECEVALAGGVNLSLHPQKYRTYGAWDMYSSDGRCHSFGLGGDGYVSAEGVGAILLKPLQRAIQDGDRIYAVIKGSAINHVGTVSGISVPSPVAQADVIEQSLAQARIDPRSISYVEAHGTGTSLGDPIEIQGLVSAFSRFTQEKQFCALGSVKSNIGHAESAAGISGLSKVVLQLYHRRLVPSLHAKELNPYLKLEQSPFYVQQESAVWKQPVLIEDGHEVRYPRRAGISSFGASGSNAHLILEEYHPDTVNNRTALTVGAAPTQALVPLSARNKERLHVYAEKIRTFLHNELSLVDLAYTLQVGRESMEERVAFLVSNVTELATKLAAFEAGQEEIEGIWRGQVKNNRKVSATSSQDRDVQTSARVWMESGELNKIAECWTNGFEVNWDTCYGEHKPRRMSLPTYPFERERYWVPETNISTENTISTRHVLHPLLHMNTSDFTEQRFSSTFTGHEFFLADHVVRGQKILPGVAYLEMARAAVERALATEDADQRVTNLKDVVWMRPIIMGEQSLDVHIGLYPEANGEVSYEIYSESTADEKRIVYSQGRAVIGPIQEIVTLDIDALRTECNQNMLTGVACYAAFDTMGLHYGPGLQGIEILYVGQDQLLAKIALPPSIRGTQDEFWLHPSLLDSAFHTSIGFIVGSLEKIQPENGLAKKLSLPFALQDVEILRPCTPVMWSSVRYSDHSNADGQIVKYDIDICDERGVLCIRMKGASLRALEVVDQEGQITKVAGAKDSTHLPSGYIKLLPSWEPIAVVEEQDFTSLEERIVVVGGTGVQRRILQRRFPQVTLLELRPSDDIGEMADRLRACGDIEHVLWIADHQPTDYLSYDSLLAEQESGVLEVFQVMKALLLLDYGNKAVSWSIITVQAQPVEKNDALMPAHASLYGLAGTMAKEYTNWKIRLIDLEDDQNWPIEHMFSLPVSRQGQAWAYRNGQWYQQRLLPLHDNSSRQTIYRKNGVYVVIGGAGYIGGVWSEYMMRSYHAQIIWIGRSQINMAIRAKLARLATVGPTPQYITADATDLQALQQAYDAVKERYGPIHGVVHAAMMLKEQSLENMNVAEFKAGSTAKIAGSVRLAQVFQQEPLDFVLFFSSLVAYIKNVKQSHYASGCTFEDVFAARLAKTWKCPVKVMNWGYWGDGTVAQDENFVQLFDQIGLGLISAEKGMEALELLLAGPIDQMALINTTRPVAIEGMQQDELIKVYPKSNAFAVPDLQLHIPRKVLANETVHHAQNMELDELLCKLLLSQLQTLGLFEFGTLSTSSRLAKHTLQPQYGKWLEESLAVLKRHRYLEQTGEMYTATATFHLDRDVLWQEWDAKKAALLLDDNMKEMVPLVDVTVRALPDILSGKILATDMMFPDSSMELVEGIYKQNQVADYFNDVLADTVAAYVQERLKQEGRVSLRILEIGAGTGGTSAAVFQKLQPYQESIREYCYTDVSRAFLLHAQRMYGPQYPYLDYRLFNVEMPVAGQDIEAGGYDLVIAANVLHATKNIRQTLRNAKAVLKNNGLLLLNEMAGKGMFTHLTFGLLEGWWLYEDPELRIAGCPGLYPESWRKVLESEGFKSIIFPAQQSHSLSHQIVVAQSDGVIRQKLSGQRQMALPDKSVARQVQEKSRVIVEKQVKNTEHVTDELLREKSTAYIVRLVGETLKIPVNKIDASDPLEIYGIDSIVVVQLTNVLRKVLDNVSSTLFFEYHTIDALVEHFLQTQKDALITLVGLDDHTPGKEYVRTDDSGIAITSKRSHATSRSKRSRSVRHSEIEPTSVATPVVRDVAIIGVSGRYAQANTVNEFWSNLTAGKNCISEIPDDRWDWREYYDAEKGKKGSIYTKWGGFIEDFDKFDPAFFQISPVEAERMDPQERLFLETAYASIEDAGYMPSTLCASRKIGVFAGVMNKNYQTGYGYWSIANRISYLLNFQGPSLAVDTACSSSLTAIHLALESLYSGSSECAIAGGVNLVVHPIHYLNLSTMNMLSTGDKCRSFGEQADGFVDGEGVGAIVLKPLHKAIEDGDHIYGVIKGSMLNAGGKTNGYTVPNPNAQFQLITEALQRADVPARTISYLEAHGTGTALGDPLEIAGLTRAFEQDTHARQFCAIGSVKSNIGHCESAAGIAGLTKILFQLKYRQLVPSLHAEVVNPNIDFEHTPFVLQQELEEWKRPVVDGQEVPLRAGISSFGAGGANAHLIIEEYIPHTGIKDRTSLLHPPIIVLSAKSGEQLHKQAASLLTAVRERRYVEADLARIAYTLQVGREPMEERLCFVVESMKELEEKLKLYVSGKEDADGLYRGQVRPNKIALAALTADEDMEKTIETWASKGKYSKLMDLWSKGLTFDWSSLYGDNQPLRISLPTYPFAKERYWLQALNIKTHRKVSEETEIEMQAEEVVAAVPESQQPSQEQEAFELMTFEEAWQEQSLQPGSDQQMKTLICFISDIDKQKALEKAVAAVSEQTRIVFVSQGSIYEKTSSYSYSLVRRDPTTYEKAFKSIRTEHGTIGAILYLWALEDAECVRDYSSIVSILQAVASAGMRAGRLLLAGQFDQGLERCYLESWIGFERSLGSVLPNMPVLAVYQELERLKRRISMEEWIHTLWAELQAQTTQTVLYQAEKRFVYSIQPTFLSTGINRLKTHGTYLITGGCGGLGMLLAIHLARQYAARLILTGRSPLNAEKQRQVEELRLTGGQVCYVQADVCDVDAMREGLRQARERFGALNGVIHAAGVESRRNIFEKEMSGFHNVIAPKIDGTLVIDTLLQREPLDFICYFSSSAAMLGDFGCCDYAVGNRFQMAYAQYRNQQQYQGKAFVINWPVWRDGGMKIGDAETTDMYLKASGQRFLEATEGINLFERILSQDNIQHLILVGQRSRVQRLIGRQAVPVYVTAPVTLIPAGKGRRGEMQGLNTEQCLEWDLKEHINILLKLPKHKLELDSNWMDFGFDSINLAEFATQLTKHYGIEISPSLFFGYSTLEKLISYFLSEHQEAVQEFYREGVGEQITLPEPVIVATEPQNLVEPSLVLTPSILSTRAEPIAIIGMSGRFPQADCAQELWDHLKDGKNCISEIPTERWDWREYYGDPHLEAGKTNAKWGGFLRDVDRFDPLFFQISPKEAETMDPRHRIFLEEAWHTLEDAGYMGERIKGTSCGVYVGVEEGEYAFMAKDTMYINGSQNATLPARIAYMLDLKGPNMALTAACSSSLVAIHQACQALRQEECALALVGGVSLNISSMSYVALSKADMLSPDGQCRVFGQGANGLVPGEAVAAVLLKPLSKAIADKDQIYGCIKASGVNYDGRTNGITAPNPLSQAELIEHIYIKYEINPLDIQYVMAHSTGSSLGDPLEIQALTSAFEKFTPEKQFCTIGSIKPLIGHTFAASGVVGLISMLMAMKDQTIPATRLCEGDSAYINFKESPFTLAKENQAWITKNNLPRVGTVSSTGISGTNAHIVLEEYRSSAEKRVDSRAAQIPQIVVLSAKNRDRLHAVARQMQEYVEACADFSLLDFAYTLQVGREAMESRLAMIVSDKAQLLQCLQEVAQGQGVNASVPLFESAENQENDYAPIKKSLRDLTRKELQHDQLNKPDFKKIAQHWVDGGHVEWELLHADMDARRISLPTYPFADERYWIATSQDKPLATHAHLLSIEEQAAVSTLEKEALAHTSIQAYMMEFLSRELGLARHQINIKKKFLEYGMDSIQGRRLIRHIESKFQIKLTGREMLEHQTIQALVTYLAKKVAAAEQSRVIDVMQAETTSEKNMPYDDQQIVDMMEQFTQGKLDFKGVQRILEGSK